jgi:thiamine pyrophosphokinase
MRALIFCNGSPPSRALCRSEAGRADLIVAADGGADMARRAGIKPDFVIGDLDSVTVATRRAFRTVPFLRVSRQDNTDLEKALDFVVAQKPDAVTILGASGKRIDFTLGNLSVAWSYTARTSITFAGDGWKGIPVREKCVMRASVGSIVSLVPFGRCSGITLRGLRYPLRNATMRVGEIAVSNVVVRSPFSVSVKSGHMLLMVLEKTS